MKRKPALQRILSLFLAIVICITIPDMTAFAATTDSGSNKADITEESTLEERLDALDNAINIAIYQHKERINVEKYHLTPEEYISLYHNLNYMHPDYNYIIDIEKMTYLVNTDGIVSRIGITYIEDDTPLREMEAAASEIINMINDSSRELKDYEKAWLAYEWLASNCSYYPGYEPGMDTSQIPAEYHTAYNSLVKKIAVCDGYARGYAYIMSKLGIPCEVVSYKSPSATDGHAWNMVQIDGNWYHADPTWGSYGEGDANGGWFLLTDSELTAKDTKNHSSSARITKSYHIKGTDGPSFIKKNALWYELDALRFGGSDIQDIAYYDGYYYYSYLTFLCRTDSLLNFDEDNMSAGQQFVGRTDGADSSLYPIVMPRSMDICVYNDCLYYHGIQRIYRLNLAEVSEEDRKFVPGKSLYIGKDITYDVIPSVEQAYYTLSMDNPTAKRESTTFIYNFNVKDNHITFDIQKSGKTAHECDFEYLVQNVNSHPECLSVKGNFELGTPLTATASMPASFVPYPYKTATPYYRWYLGDTQICKNTSGIYTPTIDDIGKMLRVEVTFDNYCGKLSKEIGVLPKMVPTLPAEAPEAVSGEKGSTLADIEPPAGYVWKEPDTVLTEIGEHSYPASYSPDSDKYEYIDASLKVVTTECNHTWDEGKLTKKATCTEAGETTFTCSKCNATKTEPIEPLGHMWDNGSITEKATCVQSGTKTYTCYRCSGTKTEEIPKTTTHSYKTGKITKTPTDTEKGVYTWDCSLCSSKKAVTLLRAKTGNFTAGMTSVRVHSSAKSTSSNIIGSLKQNAVITIFEENTNPEWTKICYNNGVAFIMTKYVVISTKVSEKKDTQKKDTDKTPKIGSQTTVKKMTYKLTSANTVKLTKTSIKSGTVTIPSSIKVNGRTYNVTSIAAKALKNNKKIKKVVIGSNIVTIEPDAFRGCKKLKTITIKSYNLKTVGKNAIKDIHKKAKISCPKNKKKTYKKYFNASTGYKKTMKIK